MTPSEAWFTAALHLDADGMTPSEAWFAAARLLDVGEFEKARELIPLMLPSDQIVMQRKIAAKEAKK